MILAAAVPILAGCSTSTVGSPPSGSRHIVVAAVPATGTAGLDIAQSRAIAPGNSGGAGLEELATGSGPGITKPVNS